MKSLFKGIHKRHSSLGSERAPSYRSSVDMSISRGESSRGRSHRSYPDTELEDPPEKARINKVLECAKHIILGFADIV